MARYMVPEVWCDACFYRVQSEDGGELDDYVEMLKETYDWYFSSAGEETYDLCPNCVEQDFPGIAVDDIEWEDAKFAVQKATAANRVSRR